MVYRFHIYTFDPDRALDRVKRSVDFPIQWTKLPLHPKLCNAQSTTDLAGKLIFIGQCHQMQTETDNIPAWQSKCSEVEDQISTVISPHNSIYLKYHLERFERKILMEKLLQLDDYEAQCVKLRNQLELMSQTVGIDSDLYKTTLELHKTENAHMKSVLQRQNEKITEFEHQIRKLTSKILNLTTTNCQLTEQARKSNSDDSTAVGFELINVSLSKIIPCEDIYVVSES